MDLPKDYKELAYTIYEKIANKDVLLVNTPGTGGFLNKMFLDKRIIRIVYESNHFTFLEEAVQHLIRLNKKFDLICVDPYHEYKESINTFNLLILLLSENGILISHDCCPPNFTCSSPTYQPGDWCGVTYAAFIEIAYNHPEWYYTVINTDYGLGVISKKEIDFVKIITNNEKQKLFLELFRTEKYQEAYDYYKTYSSDIINLIEP